MPFELEVGLTDKDGKVLSDASAYNVHGRAPFENNTISITETLAVQNKEEEDLTPESVTITPQFGQDPQAVSVENGGTAELPIRMEKWIQILIRNPTPRKKRLITPPTG